MQVFWGDRTEYLIRSAQEAIDADLDVTLREVEQHLRAAHEALKRQAGHVATRHVLHYVVDDLDRAIREGVELFDEARKYSAQLSAADLEDAA